MQRQLNDSTGGKFPRHTSSRPRRESSSMAATQAANDDFVPVLFHPAQQSSHLPRRQPQFLRRVGLLDQLLEADGTEGAFIEARRRMRLLDQAPILTIRQAGRS